MKVSILSDSILNTERTVTCDFGIPSDPHLMDIRVTRYMRHLHKYLDHQSNTSRAVRDNIVELHIDFFTASFTVLMPPRIINVLLEAVPPSYHMFKMLLSLIDMDNDVL